MRQPLPVLSLLVACQSTSPSKTDTPVDATHSGTADTSDTDTDADDSSDADTDTEEDPRLALQMAAPSHAVTDDFLSPNVCAECHSNARGADAMRTADGSEIGPHNLQTGTVMANAGRDPIFWAVLSAEQAAAPALTDAITDTCLRCHAPMARWDAVSSGEPVPTPDAVRTEDSHRASLGRDGVSCTTCHRLDPASLAAESSHTGQYAIADNTRIYGPHAAPFTNPMEHHTGFTPTEGAHMLDSEVCATCHTLQTHTVAEGALTGATFLEQSPYLEWQNSSFAGTTSCQDCHMPKVDASGTAIETAIARNPGGSDFPIEARSPFGQHTMVGGNTLLLGILRDNADVLQPRADADVLDAQIERTRQMLATSAELSLTELRLDGSTLRGSLAVRSQTGHKLPTAYPARRAWLRVQVLDASGTPVWTTGEVDAQGRLVDATGTPLPSELAGGPVLAHQEQLTDAAAVQVYELVMADADGQPVYRLLSAAQALKDNRVLPEGWDVTAAAPAVGSISPAGVGDDADYTTSHGTDHVGLAIELSGTGPYTVEASLLYQSYAPRHRAELMATDTPEVRALEAMFATASFAPETLATVSATVE